MFNHVCSVYLYVMVWDMGAGALGGQKTTSDPLELQLSAVMGHKMGYWKLNLGPTRAVLAFKH